ncbi:hypothetical protein GCM10022280_18840 [Sphingomonas swuensis]|uniref:DUF6946 domain-containing protein n=1 Tax=Sphingomonas swuensis TaxID=977800 RepID=A0ABP7T0I1_9SPHN
MTDSRLSIFAKKPDDVVPRLGSPLHWRQGRSAKALADRWMQAEGFPTCVAAMLCQAPEYRNADLLDGWFERETDLLDEQGRPSQTDLLALITSDDGLATLAVEGKVDEPFGDSVSDWLGEGNSGKLRRLELLCERLGLSTEKVATLRYQLLHRTVAALIEAKRFHTRRAVMVVHSFCPKASGFADFVAFARELGFENVEQGMLSEPRSIGDIELRVGWVSDSVPEGQDPPSVNWLTEFGRTRLSKNFFMRDFLFSEIGALHGFTNVPADPDLAIEAGKKLCFELLEPLQETFGRVAIRSSYRSPELNGFGAKMQRSGAKGYTCASNDRNAAGHIWDARDADGCMGATACIVLPEVYDVLSHEEGGWQRLAWWIHDNLPYSTLTFYPRYWAFNIQWHERPKRQITSYVAPSGTLTKPGFPYFDGEHSGEWRPLLEALQRARSTGAIKGIGIAD